MTLFAIPPCSSFFPRFSITEVGIRPEDLTTSGLFIQSPERAMELLRNILSAARPRPA
jgi:hypothetical protein